MKKNFALLLLGLWTLLAIGWKSNNAQIKAEPSEQIVKGLESSSPKKDTTRTRLPKVTFIELGSVNCIPCKMMQPIMKAVEEDYGDQIEIVFYDVRQDPAPAQQYRIRLIPTQVFLDESGNEFYRHEGILPKENIDSLLVKRDLKINSKPEAQKR